MENQEQEQKERRNKITQFIRTLSNEELNILFSEVTSNYLIPKIYSKEDIREKLKDNYDDSELFKKIERDDKLNSVVVNSESLFDEVFNDLDDYFGYCCDELNDLLEEMISNYVYRDNKFEMENNCELLSENKYSVGKLINNKSTN